MQVLFTNLGGEDASAIIDKLKEAKVPYETTGGGATVLVPNAQVHDLRLEMAGQGLPHGGGVGYEIFDRTIDGHVRIRAETELSAGLARRVGAHHHADAGSRTSAGSFGDS